MRLAKSITEPLVSDSCQVSEANTSRTDVMYDGGDETLPLFYKKQSTRHYQAEFKDQDGTPISDAEAVKNKTSKQILNMLQKLGREKEENESNNGQAVGQNDDQLKIKWAQKQEEDNDFIGHNVINNKIREFQLDRNKDKDIDIDKYIMNEHQKEFRKQFENEKLMIAAKDSKSAEENDLQEREIVVLQIVHDYITYKDKIMRVTKQIERAGDSDNQHLQLRFKLCEFDVVTLDSKADLIDEILVASKKENKDRNFILDAISKSYNHVDNRIYLIKIVQDEETNNFFIQKLVYDLEIKSEINESIVCARKGFESEKKKEDFINDRKIIGVVFADRNIQDSSNINQCFKCLSQKNHDSISEDKSNKWIGFVFQKNDGQHNKFFISLTSWKQFDPNMSEVFEFIQHVDDENQYLQEAIGICLGQFNVKIGSENILLKGRKDRVFLALGRKNNRLDFESDTKIFEVAFKKDKINLNSEDKYEFKQYRLITSPFYEQTMTQFHEFYDNYHHQIYRIDKTQMQDKTMELFAIRTIQTHNDQMESALKLLVKDHKDQIVEPGTVQDSGIGEVQTPSTRKDYFKFQSYAILNLKYNESSGTDYHPLTILQLILEGKEPGQIQTYYIKSKDIHQRKRIARQWDPAENRLAESYLLGNKGLLQVHPKFNNVFVNQNKNIQVGPYKQNEEIDVTNLNKGADRQGSSVQRYANKFSPIEEKVCANGHLMTKQLITDEVEKQKYICIESNKQIEIDIKDPNSRYYYCCDGVNCNKEIYRYDKAKKKQAAHLLRQNKKAEKLDEYHDTSRGIKLSIDDRKVIPRLKFDQETKQILIQVVFDHPQEIKGKSTKGLLEWPVIKEKEGEVIEIVDLSYDIINAPRNTVLSPSSVVELLDENKQEYRQNFQVCLQDKSAMWIKIKEYSLKWRNTKNLDPEHVQLNFIGMKLLLLRRPIDKSQQKRVVNFMPYFNENNYIIQGTQIIPNLNELDQDHVILQNFKSEDFQFKGDLFASGYKIYVEDGNHSKQKYLLFESQYLESVWNNEDENLKKIFDSTDLNVLLEQQIIVMMNMVPQKNVLSGESCFQDEFADFLAPLEILNGTCLCSYELNSSTFIKNRELDALKHIQGLLGLEFAVKIQGKDVSQRDIDKKKQFRSSLLENFLQQYDCKCDVKEKINTLEKSLPLNQGWKRQLYEVSQDLNFQNPVMRAFDDSIWKQELKQEKNQRENQKDKNEITKIDENIKKFEKFQKIIINNGKTLIDKFMLNATNQEKSYQSYQILQCIIQLVLQLDDLKENDVSMFAKFFHDETEEEDEQKTLYSFARLLSDPRLPNNMSGAPYLYEYSGSTIPITDRKEIIKDYIINDKSFKKQRYESLKDDQAMEPIDNYSIDLKTYTVNLKLINHHQQLERQAEKKKQSAQDKKRDQYEKLGKFTEYNLAKLMEKINENYGNDIQNQGCIRAIIDYQFKDKTYNFFKFQGIIFVSMTIVPFMMGLLVTSGETTLQRFIFNTIFAVSILIQSCFEGIQLYMNGPKKYYSSIFNYVDTIMLITAYVLIGFRYRYDGNWIPDSHLQSLIGVSDGYGQWFLFIMMFLNTALFINFFYKMLYYFRIDETYGKFVDLIFSILKSLIPFLSFFFIFVIFFTIIFLILGASFGEEESLGKEFYLFNQVFQMTTGAISNPDHKFWDNYKIVHHKAWWPYIIIYAIWVVWMVFQILINTVLLNFLIALVGQAYEQVMTEADIKQYNHKAQLNSECYQFWYFLGENMPSLLKYFDIEKLENVDCFILQTVSQAHQKKAWLGFTKTMNKAMRIENRNLISEMKYNMNQAQEKFNQRERLIKEQHRQLLEDFKSTIINKIKDKKSERDSLSA